MRTICLASGKGGTSKTTLTFALAVYLAEQARGAAKAGRRAYPKTAIVDLNADQGTLSRLHHDRGRPALPYLLPLTNFVDDLASLKLAKFDVCLIDTPPDDLDIIETAVMESSAVLIPVKPSDLDLGACRTVTDLCRRRRKPFGFILTQVDGRTMFDDINAAAAAKIAKLGVIMEPRFTLRKAYVRSVADDTLKGKAGHEIDPKIAPEIAAIWEQVEKIGVVEQARVANG